MSTDSALLWLVDIAESSVFACARRGLDCPITIVGIPLDVTTSYRGGSRWASQAVRRVSKSLELCSITTGIDIETVEFCDAGDIAIPPGDVEQSLDIIYSIAKRVAEKGSKLIAIGGDHIITYPIFAAYREVHGCDCILWLDAHADLRDEYLGSKLNHATALRRILELGDDVRAMLVGLRAISREEMNYIRCRGIEVVFSWEVGKELSKIREFIEGCRRLYVSVDLDVLDPSIAPGVQTPEPMGIDLSMLLNVLTMAVNSSTIAIDFVEHTPVYDASEVTSFVVARLVVETVALLAKAHGLKYEVCFER